MVDSPRVDTSQHIVTQSLAAFVAREGRPSQGELVVVGCSGGQDSTALLAALAESGLGPLVAVYVDHGLRQGTQAEADLVARHALRLGARSTSVRVLVEPRGNLLARAREARYRALAGIAVGEGARLVAVGHTASDQAETACFRAARGDPWPAFAG